MKLLFALRRFARDFPKHFLATCLSLLILSVGGAFAATSYDVHDVPDMYLNAGITGSQTTGIQVAGPIRNGETVNFPTTSGGVLEIKQGSRVEHLYYGSATVNNTTKVVTLAGVIRDLCFNVGRTFTSCNNGRIFSKGASVRLVDDARLLNLKANVDRSNTYTASGAVQFLLSGSLAIPTFSSTAERNQQLGANPGGPARIACVTGTACYVYVNGSWKEFGTATAADGRYVLQQGSTMTGKLLINLSSGTDALEIIGIGSGRILRAQDTLASSGTLSVAGAMRGQSSLTINGAFTGATTMNGAGLASCNDGVNSKLLWNQSTGKFTCGTDQSTAGLSLQVGDARYVQIQGSTMTGSLGGVIRNKMVQVSGTGSTASGSSMVTNFYLKHGTGAIAANELYSGVGYRFDAYGQIVTQAGSHNLNVYLNNTVVCSTSNARASAYNLQGAAFTGLWRLQGTIYGMQGPGASVTVKCNLHWEDEMQDTTANAWTQSTSVITSGIATNGALKLRFGGTFGTSNANNRMSQSGAWIEKIGVNPFSS